MIDLFVQAMIITLGLSTFLVFLSLDEYIRDGDIIQR